MAVVSDFTALLSGVSWTGGLPGQAVELTYSFSAAPSPALLASNSGAAATFLPLDDEERATVRAALSQWAAVSGITFHEVTATPGDITLGMYSLSAIGQTNEAGLANYPSTGAFVDAGGPQVYGNFLPEGGDIYFDRSYQTNSAYRPDFAHVAVHEIGHALGLKHPFDTTGDTLTASLDTGSQTVLSYTGVRSATLGPLDVAAIQYLYGTKTGASHPFAQVWHGDQEALTTLGTAAAETMFGTGGNDVFYSNGGRDAISGGEGDDIVYASGGPIGVNGGPGQDTVVTGLAWTSDTSVGGTGSFRYIYTQTAPGYRDSDYQVYVNVEFLDFTNGVYSLATNTFSAVQPGAYAWTGMTDAAWGTPGNWRATAGGAATVAPGAPDSVSLVTSGTVSGTGAAGSLALGGAPVLAGVFGFGTLSGGGARTTLQAGTRVTASGGVTLAGGRIDVGIGALLEVGGSALLLGGLGTVQVDAGAVLGGYGTVSAAGVVNNGTVAASGGLLRVEGAGSGAGRWTIGAGATLSVGALGGTYAFQGAGGVLRADTAAGALPRPVEISGFSAGNSIVIGGAPGVGRAVYQLVGPGLGTLMAGAVTLTLSGEYGQTRFLASSDPSGAVTVTAAARDPLFDDSYYLAHNPDVAASGLDPWYHYTVFGFHEGRNPDAWFDTSYYLTQNPDVRAAGIDPLAHFESSGWREGREPSLLFSDAKYLAAYPDVRAAGIDPLFHYVGFGRAEGRMAFLTGGAAAADPLVDAGFYDRQLGATLVPGGVAGAQQAAWSYDATGWRLGLNPDAWFDTRYYLSHNPDVAAAGINPLAHYEVFGWREGRDASAGFSTGKYLAAYGDVKAAGMNPLLHYVSFGQAENRASFAV